MGTDVILLTLLWVCLPATVTAGVARQLEDVQVQGPEEQRPCVFLTIDGLLHADCSDRGLSEIPVDVNYSVQVLDLSNNNFAKFPQQLESFSRLITLDMSGNHLSQRLYMGSWRYLQTLNLSNNNYETWINNGNTYSIKTLDLSKNKINTVDEGVTTGMPFLASLDLSENRIYDLPPKMFATASSLDSLILSRNYFSAVPRFQSPSLRRLHLSSCQITNLDVDAFTGMNSLLEVDLSINQIESIPDYLASNTLQELDLSYNEIDMITDRTFSSLPHLAVLNLRGNEFKEVWPTSHFASNPFLREIHVKGNRWSCEGFSVNLLLTYEFLTKDPPKITDTASLICYSPSNVTQLSWQQAYIDTWHRADGTETFTVIAIMVGIIIGVVITSCVCRGLIAMNRSSSTRRTAETTALNLNGTAPQPRAESVVMRVPLQEDLPPTYDEALLMPRLNSSFHSLPDFVDEEIENENDTRRFQRRSRSIGDLTESRPRVQDRRSMRRTYEIRIDEVHDE